MMFAEATLRCRYATLPFVDDADFRRHYAADAFLCCFAAAICRFFMLLPALITPVTLHAAACRHMLMPPRLLLLITLHAMSRCLRYMLFCFYAATPCSRRGFTAMLFDAAYA